jgi:hypothetical protein
MSALDTHPDAYADLVRLIKAEERWREESQLSEREDLRIEAREIREELIEKYNIEIE